ncbi:hypothetical protein FQN53_001755 [Emmonsiellopsis sp. PD_33]|nr:hypothetical protein FQN53_001755 [Emmonsiellopsis sp. PD_33]
MDVRSLYDSAEEQEQVRRAIQASLAEAASVSASETLVPSVSSPVLEARAARQAVAVAMSSRDVVDLTAESEAEAAVDGDETAQSIVNVVKEREVKVEEGLQAEVEAGVPDDLDDPDLREAIRLSLRQQGEDADDEVGSMTDVDQHRDEVKLNEKSRLNSQESAPIPSGSALGLLGLDRKRMEEERLARVEQMKRKSSTPTSGSMSPCVKRLARVGIGGMPVRAATGGRDARTSVPLSAGNRPATISPVTTTTGLPLGRRTQGNGDSQKVEVVPESPRPEPRPLEFPLGAVKKTWVFGCERQGDDIKFEEVVQKADLEQAILSSYQWDYDWVFSKFWCHDTRLLLVMGIKEEEERRYQEESLTGLTHVRVCFPSMAGQVNCMHSKLMLLFHPGRLRIVVPSANLVPYDWGEGGGFLENIVFLIDLPETSPESLYPRTQFLDDLCYFLRQSGIHENEIKKIEAFDFSATIDMAFVHTIGGAHEIRDWERTGVCGLGRAIKKLGLQTTQDLNLDYVTSSIGSLNDQFMRSIYLAAQGDNGLKELTLRNTKTGFPTSKLGPMTQKSDGAAWKKDRFRVYFPGLRTVRNSKGGTQGAGTICCQSKWYNSATFPKHTLRENVSKRRGILMHNKMLFVRPDKPIISTERKVNGKEPFPRYLGWAYVGSANLSESAWGRLVLDRKSSRPRLNCRNWECGVVLPIRLGDRVTHPQAYPDVDGDSEAESGSVDTAETDDAHDSWDLKENDHGAKLGMVFEPMVPVPMTVPGAVLGEGEGEVGRPWFYMEDY